MPPCLLVSCKRCDQLVLDSDQSCYGCDVVGCPNWYHRECLDAGEQAQADLSVMISSDWVCPYCVAKIDRQCTVCLVSETFQPENSAGRHTADEGWVACTNQLHCTRWYHIDCLPQAEVNIFLHDPTNWLCQECGI